MFKDRAAYMRIIASVANTIAAGLPSVFGIHPWFVIKIQLSYQLHLAYAKGKLPDLSNKQPRYTVPFTSKKEVFKSAVALAKQAGKLLKTYVGVSFPNNELLAIGNSAQNKVLNGKEQNIYLQPHINSLAPKSVLMYYIDNLGKETVERQYLKQLLHFFKLYYKLRLYISPNTNKLLNNYGQQLNTVLVAELQQPIKGLEHFIAEQLVEYKVHYCAYKYWLKKIQPKTVLAYCYYDNRINAMFGAANSLGITTIESQHSVISNSHFAYAKWEQVNQLIQHFPTHFYVWSVADKQLIIANFTSKNYKPIIEVKGIKHLSLQKHTVVPNTSQNILICLQGIWMPEWLENFIRQDEQYQWYIRLHPRYPNDKEQLGALEKLQKVNIHTKAANTQSLESLLEQSKALITCFSGAALEAAASGVKVLIYGEDGKTTYQEYISNGQFSYIENKTDFKNTVNS